MRALQLVDWQSEARYVEVDDPEPGPGEVVVRVGGAGLCHSDLHLLHDFVPGTVPWQPPFTLGHENAGWVHAVGAGVRLETGAPVAVYGAWGCGSCTRCGQGFETYCERPDLAPVVAGGGGLGLDGGLAPYLRVPAERLVVPLPDGLDPLAAAPLTDAGLTPYHAVKRSWPKLVPGSTAVVVGVGGLGHLAVQILKATTSARVVAVDAKPEALELATASGADAVVAAGEGAAEAVREVTRGRGAEVVLDFVGVAETLALAVAVVRVLGDVTVVGVANGQLPWSFLSVPYEMSLQTTYWGSRPELVEVLDLAARGLVRPEVTVFDLDAAADAYRLLADGGVRGRAVVVP